MIHNGPEQPYSTLMDQVAHELQYWRLHEAERGPLPGGGLQEVWPHCAAIYGIGLRTPGIDETQAMALALHRGPLPALDEQARRQIFTLVWERARQLRADSPAAVPSHTH